MPDEDKEPKDPQASEQEAGPPEQEAPAPDIEPLQAAITSLLEGLERTMVRFEDVAEAMREAVSRGAGVPAVELPSTVDLSLYRTVTAARGLQEVNMLLAQGWEYISGEFCEEVRKRRGMGGQQSVIAWTLYATMGKRDPMAETDRQALAVDEERRAWERGVPVEGVDTEGGPDAPAGGEAPEGDPPVGTAARGRVVTAASPRQSGHEGTGALANR